MADRPFLPPTVRALDANGDPVSGALLTLFLSGTTTPATVYTDADLTTPHSSPIVADSAGVFPAFFVASTTQLKATVTDADEVTLPGYPVDPIIGIPAAAAEAEDVAFTPTTENSAENVQDAITQNPGRLLRRSFITASDASFAFQSGAKLAHFTLIGGGGAGGGAVTTDTAQASAGSGGNAGEETFWAKNIELIPTCAIVIGAGGVGVLGANGGDGGDTTVTAGVFTVTAAGGSGGNVGASSDALRTRGPDVQSNSLSVDGSVSFGTPPGEGSLSVGTAIDATKSALGGGGASTRFGAGGGGGAVNTTTNDGEAGRAARGFGGGGGGGLQAGAVLTRLGGDGSAGCVVIEEYT